MHPRKPGTSGSSRTTVPKMRFDFLDKQQRETMIKPSSSSSQPSRATTAPSESVVALTSGMRTVDPPMTTEEDHHGFSRPTTHGGSRPSTQHMPKKSTNGGATVDSWPAQGVSWTTEDPKKGVKMHQAAPKPPLLKAMEDYLERELSVLEPAEQGIGRLRIFREVFKIFTDSFKAYAPLLSMMMSEFDAAASKNAQAASRVVQLETELRSEQQRHADEMRDLQQELRIAKYDHDGAEEALRLLSKESRVKERTMVEKHSHLEDDVHGLREERQDDLEKMLTLVKTIKEADKKIRSQSEIITKLREEVEKAEDLKLALAESQARVTEMTELYKETIPRKTFESIRDDFEKRYSALEEKERALYRLSAARGAQYDKVLRIANQLSRERESFQSNGATTPRPNWKELEPVVRDITSAVDDDELITTTAWTQFLITRLKFEVSERKRIEALSTELQQKVDELTVSHVPLRHWSKQIVLAKRVPHATFLEFDKYEEMLKAQPWKKGIDAPKCDVPPHFRCVGAVERQQECGRGELSTLLHQFWELRKGTRHTKSFDESLTAYFEHSAGKQRKTPWEKAYNMFELCRQYRHTDARCDLFLGIYEGIYPERLQRDNQAFLDFIRDEILHLANAEKRRVRKAQFMEIIGPKLAHKTVADLDKLKLALGRDPSLDVDELTKSSHPFMDALSLQAAAESIDLYTQLVCQIMSSQKNGFISIEDLEDCVALAEPDTPDDVLADLCREDETASDVTTSGVMSSGDVVGRQESGGPSSPDKAASQQHKGLRISLVMDRLGELKITRRSRPEPLPES